MQLGPSTTEWVRWFEDWTELLEAQIPTLEALTLSQDILKHHNGNSQLVANLDLVRNRLSEGDTLVAAFENLHCPVPSEIFLALECGQQTGKVYEACKLHLRNWKKRIDANQALVKSMIYPFIVLLASAFCWWLLDFTTAAVKQTIPAHELGGWSFADYLIISGVCLCLITLPKALTDKKRQAFSSPNSINLVGFSPSKAWYIAQFFFSIEQELKAGFDILYCLRHRPLKGYRPFIGQKATHQQLNLLNARLHEFIKTGGHFSEAMQAAGAPDFMSRQAKISEQTGDLSSTFLMGTKLFEMEAQKRQHRIQNLLAPITLLLAALTLVAAYQSSVAPLYNNLGVL